MLDKFPKFRNILGDIYSRSGFCSTFFKILSFQEGQCKFFSDMSSPFMSES